MGGNKIDPPKLQTAIDEEDRKLEAKGVPIPLRGLILPGIVRQRLGFRAELFPSQADDIDKTINSAISSLYPSAMLRLKNHFGVGLYRGVPFRIVIPAVFGTRRIAPFDYMELPEVQRQRLNEDTEDANIRVLDQFSDVYDLDQRLCPLAGNLEQSPPISHWARKVRESLQAASAGVINDAGLSAASQAALLAAELGMKVGLVAAGKTEKEVRQYKHRHTDLVAALAAECAAIDSCRMHRVVARWPDYVGDRYNDYRMSPADVAELVTEAQFVAAETFRQFTLSQFRAVASVSWQRQYP